MKKIIISLFFCLLYLISTAQQGYEKIKVSSDIELVKLSDNAYIHISYAMMGTFGRVASNGLIYINGNKVLLFDTPANDSLTMILVSYLKNSLKIDIEGFVPNHWHSDCMGGLGYLKSIGVKSYASQKTIEIAKSKGLPVPAQGFVDSLTINLEGKSINCYYFGAAHSLDNIVVWIPSEKILFAGCMAKELRSQGLGNTVDGDVNEWPKTIDKVIKKFPTAKIVIPGHGQFGGLDLLLHTKELLSKH